MQVCKECRLTWSTCLPEPQASVDSSVESIMGITRINDLHSVFHLNWEANKQLNCKLHLLEVGMASVHFSFHGQDIWGTKVIQYVMNIENAFRLSQEVVTGP